MYKYNFIKHNEMFIYSEFFNSVRYSSLIILIITRNGNLIESIQNRRRVREALKLEIMKILIGNNREKSESLEEVHRPLLTPLVPIDRFPFYN